MSVTTLLGIANPMPGAAEPPVCGEIAASVGKPITLADRSTSAPTLLPGLIAALVWMAWGRVAPGEPSPAGSVTARPTAETMPSVTLPVSYSRELDHCDAVAWISIDSAPHVAG